VLAAARLGEAALLQAARYCGTEDLRVSHWAIR
jgi:hypothetical protein